MGGTSKRSIFTTSTSTSTRAYPATCLEYGRQCLRTDSVLLSGRGGKAGAAAATTAATGNMLMAVEREEWLTCQPAGWLQAGSWSSNGPAQHGLLLSLWRC